MIVEKGHQILIKLRFKELFDSELSGLHAADNSHFTEFRNEVKIRNTGCE